MMLYMPEINLDLKSKFLDARSNHWWCKRL